MAIHLHKIDKESPIHYLLHDGPDGSLIFLEANNVENDLCSTWNLCQTAQNFENTQNWLFLHPILFNNEGVMAKTKFAQYPLKTSSKTGGTPVRSAKNGQTLKMVEMHPKLEETVSSCI